MPDPKRPEAARILADFPSTPRHIPDALLTSLIATPNRALAKPAKNPTIAER